MLAALFEFLPEIATFLFTAFIGFILHTGLMDHATLAAQKELTKQKSADAVSCQSAQQSTIEASRETDKRLSDARNVIATLRLRRPSRCVHIIHNSGTVAGIHDTPAKR